MSCKEAAHPDFRRKRVEKCGERGEVSFLRISRPITQRNVAQKAMSDVGHVPLRRVRKCGSRGLDSPCDPIFMSQNPPTAITPKHEDRSFAGSSSWDTSW